MSNSRRSKSFPPIENPNRGTKAPTGKYKPETGLAKKQQHHDRPEYAQQTKIQSSLIMQGGLSRQEAKRQAKAIIRDQN